MQCFEFCHSYDEIGHHHMTPYVMYPNSEPSELLVIVRLLLKFDVTMMNNMPLQLVVNISTATQVQ